VSLVFSACIHCVLVACDGVSYLFKLVSFNSKTSGKPGLGDVRAIVESLLSGVLGYNVAARG